MHCPSRWRRVGNRLLALLVLFCLHKPPLGLVSSCCRQILLPLCRFAGPGRPPTLATFALQKWSNLARNITEDLLSATVYSL
jgi:hypothetical protein